MPTRLSDLPIGKSKKHRVQRQIPNEQFRAYCIFCSWTGNWRSDWSNSYDSLIEDVSADYVIHLEQFHPDKVAEFKGEMSG